jgi:hypothetical protein
MVGEHIRARRGGQWNHAIDCGDETVIHLSGGMADAPRVVRSYRPEFVSGAEAVEVVTHRERTFTPSEIVARAYSRVADAALATMFRDSEAFAQWCAIGRIPAGPRDVARSVPGSAAAARAAPAETRRAPPARPKGARGPRGREAAARKAGAKVKPKAKRGVKVVRTKRPARTTKRARQSPRPRARSRPRRR